MSSEFKRAISEATLINKKEVFSFEFKGKRYWIKRARRSGSNLAHHLAWKITKIPLLIPVEAKTPEETLEFEAQKLKRLKSLGVLVPSVESIEKEFFVMEDSGKSVRHHLREAKSSKERQIIYKKLFEAIALLHKADEYHGASQIRNFTYKDDRVYIIDFEESFSKDIDIKILQFRDIFLLLFSLAKDRFDIDYREYLLYYSKVSGNSEIFDRLRDFISRVEFIEKIIGFKPLYGVLDKDTKALYRLIGELKVI